MFGSLFDFFRSFAFQRHFRLVDRPVEGDFRECKTPPYGCTLGLSS